ncbi:hypothetical protein CYMTET_24334 [Cymbomonas tetramitiformis]|uniref:Uncharacterized protein n=1 Tax=Cymbomonas tetramitiformis TaxID=36881 RepID=A0AAE0FW42_9CHLO|nr:hypothetical protein CYMTET_24334 [Cymbomonas tetramitiformis]
MSMPLMLCSLAPAPLYCTAGDGDIRRPNPAQSYNRLTQQHNRARTNPAKWVSLKDCNERTGSDAQVARGKLSLDQTNEPRQKSAVPPFLAAAGALSAIVPGVSQAAESMGYPVYDSDIVSACAPWGNLCILAGTRYIPIGLPSILGSLLLLVPLGLALSKLDSASNKLKVLQDESGEPSTPAPRVTDTSSQVGNGLEEGVVYDEDGWIIPAVLEDAEGRSYFGEKRVPLGPPTGANGIGRLSEQLPAAGLICRETPGNYDFEWHVAPRKQYIINLDAPVEVEVDDGSKRIFPSGSIFYVADTQGRGHKSSAVEGRARRSIFIPEQ